MFPRLNSFKEVVWSSFCTIQTKVLDEIKPTHDDIIEAKEVYIQLSFEKYEGKLV